MKQAILNFIIFFILGHLIAKVYLAEYKKKNEKNNATYVIKVTNNQDTVVLKIKQ